VDQPRDLELAISRFVTFQDRRTLETVVEQVDGLTVALVHSPRQLRQETVDGCRDGERHGGSIRRRLVATGHDRAVLDVEDPRRALGEMLPSLERHALGPQSVEQRLDDIAVGAQHRRLIGHLFDQSEGVDDECAFRQLIGELDRESSGRGQRFDGLAAADERTADDAADLTRLEPFDECRDLTAADLRQRAEIVGPGPALPSPGSGVADEILLQGRSSASEMS
jgi:hypothetical protein